MAQDVIAIICDCDGTLCPDTTNQLVSGLGILKEIRQPAGRDPLTAKAGSQGLNNIS